MRQCVPSIACQIHPLRVFRRRSSIPRVVVVSLWIGPPLVRLCWSRSKWVPVQFHWHVLTTVPEPNYCLENQSAIVLWQSHRSQIQSEPRYPASHLWRYPWCSTSAGFSCNVLADLHRVLPSEAPEFLWHSLSMTDRIIGLKQCPLRHYYSPLTRV